jgi:hypothetical protein
LAQEAPGSGLLAYLEAVERAFGAGVDYAMRVKLYGPSSELAKGRYSPAEFIGARKETIEGNPDPAHISASYAERQNLNVRMHTRRFTRLTNAFSKKVENHAHSVACSRCTTTSFASIRRYGHAGDGGKSDRAALGMSDIVDRLEAWEATND